MNKDNIHNITIWIKYQKSFRIRDLFWEITDKICYSQDLWNPFEEDFFVEQFQDNWTMILRSDKIEWKWIAYIRLDYDNIVFSYPIKSSENITESIEFIKKVMNYMCKLLSNFNISNFIRLWIIFNHKIKWNNKNLGALCKEITWNKIQDFNEFSCRFSKRIKDNKALVDKKNKDFNNLIYNIWSSKNEFEIWLDYQYYYVPCKPWIAESDVKDFLSNSEYFLDTYFYQGNFITNEEK